jgi:hypothetical protein
MKSEKNPAEGSVVLATTEEEGNVDWTSSAEDEGWNRTAALSSARHGRSPLKSKLSSLIPVSPQRVRATGEGEDVIIEHVNNIIENVNNLAEGRGSLKEKADRRSAKIPPARMQAALSADLAQTRGGLEGRSANTKGLRWIGYAASRIQ